MTIGIPRGARQTVLALLLTSVVAACATPAPAGLTETDRAQLASKADSATAAASRGDVTTWSSMYADDAVMLPPNAEPVSGRAAIAEVIKSFPPLSGVKFSQVTVEGSGDLAWVQGTYELTMTPPGSAAISDRGKYIEIWRKGADGNWMIIRDIYNTSVPMPAPAAP